jgi:inorganic triphosphatase YgiF
MSTETELKLHVDGVTAEHISAHPAVRKFLREEQPEHLLGNIYFDTPDLKLQEQKIGLRLRRDGDQWLQTVKTKGSSSGGLHRRGEWEMPVAGEALELERFDAKELAPLFKDEALCKALAPVFRTDFQRTGWVLAFPDGTVVEMVLDRGEIIAGDRREPITEVELEMKGEGSVVRLFGLARALVESLPMRVLNASKAERGYRLGGYAPAYAATKSGPVGLEMDYSAEEAFVHILHHGLLHLQANEPVLLHNPEDREAVHQMRVATRRMRSCLKLYQTLIPKTASLDAAVAIRRITDALGPARDWDVFIAETLGPLAERFTDHRPLKTLIKAAEERRQAAYQVAIDAVLSPDYTLMLLEVGQWLEERAWRDGLSKKQRRALDAPARAFARQVLSRHHKKVTRFGERFTELDAKQRHRLRIRCKALRYAGEFFAELYSAKRALHYAQGVAALQDVLGVLNDGCVLQHLLDELGGGKKAPATDLVQGWTAANATCHLERFDAAWSEFRAHRRFWK